MNTFTYIRATLFCVLATLIVPAFAQNYTAPATFSFSHSGSNTAFTNRYILVNTSTSLIAYVSSTTTFSSVSAGTYQLYAVNYDPSGTAPTLNTGTALSAIGGSCVALSTATAVTVTADCSSSRPATPTLSASTDDEVCLGTSVTLTTNCATGTSVLWSTGANSTSLVVTSSTSTSTSYTAKCVSTSTGCESLSSAAKVLSWKTLVPTIINIGSSLSGTKSGSNITLSSWKSQYVTADSGPILSESTQANPTLFYTENTNKGAPRYWTIHVESCAFGTAGSVSYDLLCTLESGTTQSFNTHENNVPYFMYANQGYTELYSLNHGSFGFYQLDNTGKNIYDSGLPKGLYKLGIRYWDQKGQGLYPAVRTGTGNVLFYKEYWFRIQSQNGIGTGASRVGAEETPPTVWTQIAPNPASTTFDVTVADQKGNDVALALVDLAGLTHWQKSLVPETNRHQETVNISTLPMGLYFMQVSTPTKRATLKVIKGGL